MPQTGLIIGYTLRKPKKASDKQHHGKKRRKDRRALRKHLLDEKRATRLQRSLWYLKTQDSPDDLKDKLRGLKRATKESKISLLLGRDRLVIFPTNWKPSVRVNLLD